MSTLPGLRRARYARPRWPSDWYVEPVFAVGALFECVRFEGTIHDPACGGSTIPKIARTRGMAVTASDLVERGFGESGIDFLSDTTPRANLVSSPPYKLAELFVHHALAVAEHKVAMSVRTSFAHGQARYRSLFAPHPPALILSILSRCPSMPPGGCGIPARGGTTDHVWLLWIARTSVRLSRDGLNREPGQQRVVMNSQNRAAAAVPTGRVASIVPDCAAQRGTMPSPSLPRAVGISPARSSTYLPNSY